MSKGVYSLDEDSKTKKKCDPPIPKLLKASSNPQRDYTGLTGDNDRPQCTHGSYKNDFWKGKWLSHTHVLGDSSTWMVRKGGIN